MAVPARKQIIPDHTKRVWPFDLMALAKAVVMDRLSIPEVFTEETIRDPHRLYAAVSSALAARFEVVRDFASDEDWRKIKSWETYCQTLYEAVGPFIVSAINGSYDLAIEAYSGKMFPVPPSL